MRFVVEGCCAELSPDLVARGLSGFDPPIALSLYHIPEKGPIAKGPCLTKYPSVLAAKDGGIATEAGVAAIVTTIVVRVTLSAWKR